MIKDGRNILLALITVLAIGLFSVSDTYAITAIPTPPPQPGSFGVEAVKKQPPPTIGATISTPSNGSTSNESLITITGICPSGLLVQIFDNGVMVGAVMCVGGSFSLQITLFAGVNDISAGVYDDLGQPGPESNTVSLNYTDTNFKTFGSLVTLTSQYGRRSAPSGSELTWPLQLQGGVGPYALSIDWGDGTKLELKSQSIAGALNIAHNYKKAGIYQVNISVTDSAGTSAFLQVVAVASGKVTPDETKITDTKKEPKKIILWVPAVICFILLMPTYWLGRRSQLVSLHNKMLKERDAYEKDQANK